MISERWSPGRPNSLSGIATHQLGPDDGTLQVKTYREGVAQKIGHDLVIEVERWEAQVELGADGALESLRLDADSRSLQVREGNKGLKPLTDKDRRDIRGSIDEKVLRGKPIAFESSAIATAGGNVTVEGKLTIAGETREALFELQRGDDGRIHGTLPVTQSEWGIKPYRGLMGALKVRDEVEIVIDARLPAA